MYKANSNLLLYTQLTVYVNIVLRYCLPLCSVELAMNKYKDV